MESLQTELFKPKTREIKFKINGIPIPNRDQQCLLFPKFTWIEEEFKRLLNNEFTLKDFIKRVKNKCFISHFKPKHAEQWKKEVMEQARKYVPFDMVLSELPLSIKYFFIFDRPSSTKRQFHTVRPDWDNLSKIVGDGLQDVGFFKSDAQIFDAHVKKVYSQDINLTPGVIIVINYFIN